MGRKSKWSWVNEETAKEYYLENFEGMSSKELENEDGGFYRALGDRGLLDTIRPFYNMQEFQEHLEERGLLEDLFDEHIMVKDVDKFSEIVKEYCKYNCQSTCPNRCEPPISVLNFKSHHCLSHNSQYFE